ncbi:MAG: 23S rRNA (adenine(2030)-N(6))-methyltransferase RlmJ [Methylomicrobium sp.]
MLSYRHGFHAGNFADVLKHSLLCLAIDELKKKDKPFVYIDTHAGAGVYSLHAPYAEKTGEYRQGIGRLWTCNDLPASLAPYFEAIRAVNSGNALRRYPGSPALVRAGLRPQDRMQLSELHGSDFTALQAHFQGDRQVAVAREDGLKQLAKKLPPIQKRGLIFIDPSYEVKDDYARVVDTIAGAYRRFATGVYCLWYPVIRRDATERLMSDLAATGIRKQLRIEHCIASDHEEPGMTGSGLLWINPPWTIEKQAQALLPWLHGKLEQNGGHWSMDWQVPE